MTAVFNVDFTTGHTTVWNPKWQSNQQMDPNFVDMLQWTALNVFDVLKSGS
jgi:hypothetical protein